MAYQSLYRRYRPQRFSEVRGQPYVVAALRNAVRDERVSHAYLFSGPRGTGKTSTARIMAKALNCENLTDGEPCGECESCRAIEAGTSYDLQELDAASNNGVDAMRDLIARAALGSPGRTKVYILDEVHMLSTAASNALLKTLEEPPPHVVFVLATTDPEKVLRTIRSRTQHLEFHLLPADELAEHVRWVAGDAGLDVDDDAVAHVLRAGGGSARDTLSALDQVVAAGGVVDSAGRADDLVDAIVHTDTGAALRAVEQAVQAGRDPRVLGEALLARLRDVFLQRMGVALDHLPDSERTQVAAWAEELSDRGVTRSLEAVGEALLEMRQAPDVRIPLEVALVRITRVETDVSLDALLARIEHLEARLAGSPEPAAAPPPPAGSGATTPDAPPASGPPPAPARPARGRPGDAARAALTKPAPDASQGPPPAPPAPATAPSAPARSASPPLEPPASTTDAPPAEAPPADAPAPGGGSDPGGLPDRDALTMAWGDTVLPGLRGLTKALYSAGRFLDSDGGHAVFALPDETHRAKCADRLGDVEAALATHFGFPVPVQLVIDRGATRPADETGPDEGGPTPSAPVASDRAIEDRGTEDIDLSELTDAPADQRTPVDRVSEVFPGAEVVDGN
ncbi:MAG TPA: DNA polymerase III subunit gamma/tau [Acidimicrobiales bacterium]|jgi:DNA polymerase-3 subunit gamma/tau|nr:DNA polymerase III subunit gamma/tau [Acidimicrobiales bacterium]